MLRHAHSGTEVVGQSDIITPAAYPVKNTSLTARNFDVKTGAERVSEGERFGTVRILSHRLVSPALGLLLYDTTRSTTKSLNILLLVDTNRRDAASK
jgi:hypothetical protein